MNEEYNNLKRALGCFMEDWWLPYSDSFGMLNHAIQNKMVIKEELTEDFIKVTKDVNFDWISLAIDSQLLITPENYSNEDIKNYVKFLLQDYLFPEKAINESEIESMNQAVEEILKSQPSLDGWVLACEVFEDLKRQEQFKKLEYYNLWKIPFAQKKILQKYINGKDREIGYLRYNTENLT